MARKSGNDATLLLIIRFLLIVTFYTPECKIPTWLQYWAQTASPLPHMLHPETTLLTS